MNQLVTTIIDVDYSGLKNPLDIEQRLKAKFGHVVRWAIISVTGDKAKVSVTYETDFGSKHHDK